VSLSPRQLSQGTFSGVGGTDRGGWIRQRKKGRGPGSHTDEFPWAPTLAASLACLRLESHRPATCRTVKRVARCFEFLEASGFIVCRSIHYHNLSYTALLAC
jgi:hypothetical protein